MVLGWALESQAGAELTWEQMAFQTGTRSKKWRGLGQSNLEVSRETLGEPGTASQTSIWEAAVQVGRLSRLPGSHPVV